MHNSLSKQGSIQRDAISAGISLATCLVWKALCLFIGYKSLCSPFHVLEPALDFPVGSVIVGSASALRRASITVDYRVGLVASFSHPLLIAVKVSATDPRHRSNLFRARPTSFSDVHNPIPLASTQGSLAHLSNHVSAVTLTDSLFNADGRRVQVTIQINAPGHALDEEFLPLDADISSTLAALKTQVHDGTGFPITSIQFFLNGAPVVGDDKTLDQAGIKNGEMLYMLVREQNNMPRQQTRPQQAQPPQQGQGRFSNDQIETLRLQLLGNPQAMQQVSQERPELAAATSDPVRFRELYINSIQQAESRERERREQMQLLNDDPFNIEAQQKIEEIIRQDRVMENLEYAYEHNPEGMKTCIVSTNRHSY
jgi:hypothetical protein